MTCRMLLAAAVPLLLAACHSAPGDTVATEPLPSPPSVLATTQPSNSAGGRPVPGAETITATGNGLGPAIAEISTEITGPVNGLYYGNVMLLRGVPFEAVPTSAQMPQLLAAASKPLGCPPSSYGNLEVGDRTIDFAYTPGLIFVAPVPPDGKLHATAGSYVMDGTLIGGRLNMRVTGPECESVLALHRVPYF